MNEKKGLLSCTHYTIRRLNDVNKSISVEKYWSFLRKIALAQQ